MNWTSTYTMILAVVISLASAFLATPSLALTVVAMWSIVGVAELVSVKMNDATISRLFWSWKDDPSTPKWKVYTATIGGITIPLLIVVLHLLLAI
jgi:hypothetical protein